MLFLWTPSDDCELGVPGSLFEGDIRTHHFHGFETNIVDQSQGLNHSLHTSLFEARARGVKFDVGHGQGGFSWTVAEISAKEGFWPDTISTDLHKGNDTYKGWINVHITAFHIQGSLVYKQ